MIILPLNVMLEQLTIHKSDVLLKDDRHCVILRRIKQECYISKYKTL